MARQTRDRGALSYMPLQSPGRWRPYGATGGNWQNADVEDINSGYTATLPPPPRPPRLAAMLANADRLGLSSSYYNESREIQHTHCWRLRWCALCLVIAVALQASLVGSKLQIFFSDTASSAVGAKADLIQAALMLFLLLISMWSLLSQLLLWSDSAVMKIPSGVTVTDATRDVDNIKI